MNYEKCFRGCCHSYYEDFKTPKPVVKYRVQLRMTPYTVNTSNQSDDVWDRIVDDVSQAELDAFIAAWSKPTADVLTLKGDNTSYSVKTCLIRDVKAFKKD